jgi:hypothetical protein
MAAHDISRHLFNPAKHYTGTRMQQGRVILDSDLNEARMLDEEVQRALVVDVIGPHGTSDDGFKIAIADDPLSYDFVILSGAYYLGGLRHEIADVAALPQHYLGQDNWLQSNRTDELLAHPTLPDVERHDLVYLVGWQQGVSAVEDEELREPAIAAHDAGFRIRNMHQVRVRPGGPADCVEAFTAMVNQLCQDTGGTFDHVNYELRSGARLAVTVGPPEAEAADLCKPPVLQGFAGAENLAIRVELIAPDTFLWGIDNAAPLHRISVAGDLTTITFLEPLPIDPANLPRVDQVLEILPLGARLANDEKTADYPIAADIGGHVLARILTPYDPISQTLTVAVTDADTDRLEAMLAWDDDDDDRMFARVWNPGDASPKDSFGVTFTPNSPVALPGTGLKVTFTAAGIPGDHWIIASRPSTPRGVVPWALRGGPGAPPTGPRRFYSPLALIHWTLDGMEIKPAVEDCRRRFRPLTRLRGCCTVTVGDDATSYGDFSSIQDAVDAIPLLEPGRICVLPGEYEERVVLHQRADIVISGCGARTIIRTPADNDTSEGLFTLDDCDRVTLKNLRIAASGQFGVMVVNESTHITIDGLDITTTLSGVPKFDLLPTEPSPYPPGTLVAHHVEHLVVRDCKLTQSGETSRFPNVLLSSCVHADMRRCEVLTPGADGGTSHAWGGVQLIQGDDVTIADNEIRYGEGHGITLGTITWEGLPDDYTGWFYPAPEVVMGDEEEDCPENKGGPDPPSLEDPIEAFPVAAPTNLRIVGNRIRSMGGSGISVLGFMPVPYLETDPYLMIESYDLVIAENIVEDNFKTQSSYDEVGTLLPVRAFGGVILADSENLQIRDNVIRHNGVDFIEPACGIYVFHGENVAIERNQIYANGERVPGIGKAGHRAGIALQSVGRRVTQGELLEVAADRFLPAVTVRGNIVHQPAGRALQIYGLGAMLVEGNTLTSEGPGEQDIPNDYTDCVEIHNIGQGSELLLATTPDPAPIPLSPHPALYYISETPLEEFLEGRILFKDNQVRYSPVGEDNDIDCATRIQTFGDAAVLDNQFFTTFPAGTGKMETDTIVVAWSTRTNNNRWDDPALVVDEDPLTFQTNASARTLAVMNFTTLNQATRCIHAELVDGSPVPGPVAVNQVLTICDP